MSLNLLTEFFMWCTIIDGVLLLLMTLLYAGCPGCVYRLQSRVAPVSREVFDQIFYAFIGLFKIGFLIFNLVPFLALLIIG